MRPFFSALFSLVAAAIFVVQVTLEGLSNLCAGGRVFFVGIAEQLSPAFSPAAARERAERIGTRLAEVTTREAGKFGTSALRIVPAEPERSPSWKSL